MERFQSEPHAIVDEPLSLEGIDEMAGDIAETTDHGRE
jgi:hypothetical protein